MTRSTTILRALGVPISAAALSVGSSNTGGIAGQRTGQRWNNSPMILAGAQRFHQGGAVGLAPDEAPIIAQKQEEVLTASVPRDRNNIGKSGREDSNPGNVTVIQARDEAHALEVALSQPRGTRVFFDFIRENQSTFKAALG